MIDFSSTYLLAMLSDFWRLMQICIQFSLRSFLVW